MSVRRLAIVGGGPRAAYALESLARIARRRQDDLPGRIDIYEPRERLGTGPAYEIDQPSWVRLNLPQQSIDAGAVATGSGAIASDLIGDLMSWSGAAPAEPDRYPARADAGRYLSALVHTCIAELSPAVVRHRRHTVTSVVRSGGGFLVGHDAGVDAYDAVLLVTGHAGGWHGALAPSADVVPALPLGGLVSRAVSTRPTRVCVRGASLTAIDAVLALTEGLGGRFGGGERPAYEPGDIDVRVVMVSRTGRLMSVKTETRVLRSHGVEEAVAVVMGEHEAGDSELDVTEVVRDAAATALRAGGGPASFAASRRQVDQVWDELATRPTEVASEQLRRSLEQARGQRAPDAAWALGQAWRCGLPWLARHHEALGLRRAAPLGWRGYAQVAPELERLAFGPPPVNAAKMLALMDAGRLEVRRVDDVGAGALAAACELVVDAVSAPPGVRDIDDPLWTQLMADGLVTIAPYGRGAAVDRAGRCIDAAGTPLEGLSAVGRMTEDVVLGNDTLSRTMHGAMEHWASAMCRGRELVS